MKHSASPLLLSCLLLAGCGVAQSADLETLLGNPLYAEQYYDAQVDHMVDFLMGSGSWLAHKDIIDETRVDGLSQANKATSEQNRGKMGILLSDTEEATGEVLLLDGVLYLGPEFRMLPGVDIHAYLTTAVDPRDDVFPDESAVDLGSINTVFGAATYAVPASVPDDVRTFVLYDNALERIVGFAQLSSR